MSEKSVFATLSAIDITDKLKKKQNLSYLPWSSAWAIIKGLYPDATCHPVPAADGCLYHTDGKTCWVETTMTINGETQNETLAVMDHRNASIPADTVQSTQFEKSIKRCMTKNAALFGLGLSLWNGEELSDEAKATRKKKQAEKAVEAEKAAAEKAALDAENAKIIELAKKKIDGGVDKETVYAVVQKYSGGKKNPNAIKTMDESKVCYAEINELKGE